MVAFRGPDEAADTAALAAVAEVLAEFVPHPPRADPELIEDLHGLGIGFFGHPQQEVVALHLGRAVLLGLACAATTTLRARSV